MSDEGQTRYLEYVDIDELQPDARNPKAHAQAALASSMKRFGYTSPIEVDERTGKIVSGHGRLERLLEDREAGREPPDGVVEKDGRWLAPVVRGWSSKDDAEALAYIVAANTITEVGEWDFAKLADTFAELSAVDFTLIEPTGWTAKEAKDLIDLMALPMTPAELSHNIGPHDPGTYARRFAVLLTRDENMILMQITGDAPDDRVRFERLLAMAQHHKTVVDSLPPWDTTEGES